jgi:hypothetical protein
MRSCVSTSRQTAARLRCRRRRPRSCRVLIAPERPRLRRAPPRAHPPLRMAAASAPPQTAQVAQ